jgi:cytochrome bd ubiquinol oxidase subunit I
MIKITVLVMALAAFLALLVLYIAPQQGALQSSTELNAKELLGAEGIYQETLPIQEVDIGSQGRSIFIAVVMLGHILYANLHLGGAWIVIITEFLYLRSKERRQRVKRLAKSLTLFNVILFSVGATFASAGVFFFIALFPTFSASLFHLYWWPLLAESVLFGVEILFLYSYWYSWDKIGPRKHQLLGFGYAVSVFFQTLAINTVAAGMLTPGGSDINWGFTGLFTMPLDSLISWWNNGTLWYLQFHRLAGSRSFFGFLLAALSMFHYLDRKNPNSRKYWDWVGSYGMEWGLLGLVFQPGLGLMFMFAIQSNQPEAFSMIMHGPRAWEMLWMVGLLSALIISSVIYFIDRREQIATQLETRTIYLILKILLITAVVAAIILINPSWIGSTFRGQEGSWINPAGLMIYKYIALVMLIIVGSVVLMIDTFILGDIKDQDWGNIPQSARAAGITSGMLGMWLIITMGFVRESARSPWLVYKIIPVPGQENYPTPLSIGNILAVWALILISTMAVFWLVSRETSEDVEEVDELVPPSKAWD